ncbi:hypothetical protein AAHA92_12247 [Salvia divinorum]|uniref:Uncharacterized protein n=1 Tax=Salvia divinorum TaxID=28513 RepID=A0ABD1HJM8_SALDI
MAGENGRRLDNRNEKPTSSFPIVNSERISICESKQQENGRSPDSSHDVRVECRNGTSHAPSEASSSRLENSSITDVGRDPFALTESPAIQVMERPKTSDPMDSPSRWSVDSGDSLFSIHMESGSISKERSLSISGDIGELSLSEAYLPRVSPKSGELHQSVNSSYTSSAAAAARALEEARRVVKEDTKSIADQLKGNPPEASVSVQTDPNLSRSNPPQPHDDIDNESCVSPSTSESRCPMCECLCCARMCSCCRWPSCSNSCISCTNLYGCLTSCYCCSWKRRVRCVSSHALMDRNVGSSSKHKV